MENVVGGRDGIEGAGAVQRHEENVWRGKRCDHVWDGWWGRAQTSGEGCHGCCEVDVDVIKSRGLSLPGDDCG